MENRDMEERLRRLAPKPPSDRLKERIAVALAEDPKVEDAANELKRPGSTGAIEGRQRRGKVIWGTTFTALVSAMAAVWTVILVLDHRAEPPRMGDDSALAESQAGAEQAGTARFEVAARPIDRYATLLEADPSPVYFLDNGQPVQKVALRYLDTEVWELPESEETFTVSSLRDEIRVVSVESF